MFNFDDPRPKSASNGPTFRYVSEQQRREHELLRQCPAEGSGAGLASIVEQAHEPETPLFVETSYSPATPPHNSDVPPTPANSPAASADASNATLPISVSLSTARALCAFGRNGRNCCHSKCIRKRDLSYCAPVIKMTQSGSTRPGNLSSEQGKEDLKKAELAGHRHHHEEFFAEPSFLHYNQDDDSGSDITTLSFTDGPFSDAVPT